MRQEHDESKTSADPTDPDGHGSDASTPSDIPSRGWKDILMRVVTQMNDDHISLVAGSVAFYGLLAIFPAIGATIAIWGLVFDPQQLSGQFEAIGSALPPEAASILTNQARQVAGSAGAGLSIAVVVGFLFALYSSSNAVKSLIEGINIIYDQKDTRSFLHYNLVAFGLTLALIALFIVSLALVAVLPGAIAFFRVGDHIATPVTWLRWPLLALFVVVSLAVLYRFGPCRSTARWRWVSWGAVGATVVWIAGSIGFSIYVRNFASYNETYGSLGAVIILLMWFWLSAFIVLMGAELNAEMEHQTARDSTRGPARPMGRRGATMADTLGERRPS